MHATSAHTHTKRKNIYNRKMNGTEQMMMMMNPPHPCLIFDFVAANLGLPNVDLLFLIIA